MSREDEFDQLPILAWLNEQEKVAQSFLSNSSFKKRSLAGPLGTLPTGYQGQRASDDSIAGLLQKIINLRSSIRSHLALLPTDAGGDGQATFLRALNDSFGLAGEWAEVQLLMVLGPNYRKGSALAERQVRATTEAVRKRKAIARHADCRQLAQKMWNEDPSLGVHACARRIIKQLGLKRKIHTIAEVIRPDCPRPKRRLASIK